MNTDLYVRREAWFHRLDPRTKFATTLCFAALALILNQPEAMFGALAALHLLSLSTRIPARRLGETWRALLVVTLMIVVLNSILLSPAPDALFRLGPIYVTPGSIRQALFMALRINTLAFAFMLTLWTTEQGELVAGMTRLGLPHGLSLTLAIAMQFIPTFVRISGEIMEAQQARGLVIPRRNPVKAARAYLPVLVPLLITALRTADNLSMALAARGYGAGGTRSSRRQLRLLPRDWLLILALAALIGSAGAWRIL